ncbi:prepilin-type N-terminal cleavage/methylation domain-containing protein [Desulfobacterium sp. N47]|uniref:Prepilin-type N-terminal cleavage/methylation domain-containing protein n=1 Tax=uncultured Desulfobacterium sp. TaxID=201089 RepID=E1YHV2_9BACT|nr:hypothetical protein N47_D30300 [uncultured Desulfobacterium sp.]
MIQKLRGEKGFTLIELMIVIAIIGILAAIAIPNFISYRDKAYCSYAEGDAQNILAAISCYFAEPNNTTLTDIGSLQNDATCKVTLNGAGAAVNVGTVTPNDDNADGITGDSYTVTVTDGSGRCPRAVNPAGGTFVYTTFMGTTTAPGWL